MGPRAPQPDLGRTGQLLRQVAAEWVMPRFRRLQASQRHEKSPGEVVTVADLDAERALTQALPGLLPGSQVIGEEAVATDPSRLSALGHGDVWLVDPIDGTANFAAGQGPFSVMVAWLRDGHAEAAWIFDPLVDRLIVARRGGGVHLDGRRLHVQDGPPGTALHGLVETRLMPADLREVTEAALASMPGHVFQRCARSGSAGEDYPRLVLGALHVAIYWRTSPWDHVPGALLLSEAGGHVARLDGSPYRAADPRSGLLAASSEARWKEARALLPFLRT